MIEIVTRLLAAVSFTTRFTSSIAITTRLIAGVAIVTVLSSPIAFVSYTTMQTTPAMAIYAEDGSLILDENGVHIEGEV